VHRRNGEVRIVVLYALNLEVRRLDWKSIPAIGAPVETACRWTVRHRWHTQDSTPPGKLAETRVDQAAGEVLVVTRCLVKNVVRNSSQRFPSSVSDAAASMYLRITVGRPFCPCFRTLTLIQPAFS